jgi:LacI family sucrose operon transcriptional repressor
MSSSAANSPEVAPGKSSARAVTLAQLARHVGVSSAAVSVVVNNTESRIKVSETTRKRILEAARELNYQPNALARSLLNRQTNVIGFCSALTNMLEPMHPFLGALLQGMLAGCREHEKNLLMYSRIATLSENDLYVEVLNGQLDGLVLFAHEPTLFTRRLLESHLPVITVTDAVRGFPCVGGDDDSGGRLLVRYLVEKGYKRALYWAPSHVQSSSMETRLASYLDEAATCGLSVVVQREQHPFEPVLEKHLKGAEPPDVISVYCDYMAVYVMQGLNNIGLQVPRDVALTGYDGVPGSYPSFTTIRAPWKEVAQTAVALLMQQSEGKSIPMHTILPVELVASETA